MKFMIVALGTAGEVFPLIALGKALSTRGHEIRIASSSVHERFIQAAGLAYQEIAGVATGGGHPDFYHPTRSMDFVAQSVIAPGCKPVYELLADLDPREWSIVSSVLAYGARMAQERHGFRLATCVVSPFMLRSSRFMPVTPGLAPPAWSPEPIRRAFFRLVSKMWDRRLAPVVNAYRAEIGLRKVDDIWWGWAFSTDKIVSLFPDWFAKRAPDWPAQFEHGDFLVYDADSRNEATASTVEPGEQMVIFCAGSAGPSAKAFFEAAVEACRGRKWRATLLAPGFASEKLPDNVVRCDYVPLSRLLSKSAALVHHGGMGSIAAAVTAGVPQIVIPFGHDQFDNAARVERSGLGRVLTPKHSHSAPLAAAIEQVLSDERMLATSKSRAADYRSSITVARVCEIFERNAAVQ